MEKEKTIKIVIALIIVVIIGVTFVFFSDSTKKPSTVVEKPSVATFEKLTEKEESAVVTQPTEMVSYPTDISDPSAPQENISVYKITAKDGVFSPNEFIFEKGKRVQMQLVSEDATYDLDIAMPIGAYVTAEAGKSAIFGFDTKDKEGVYVFSCKNFCPTGKEMKGKIIIK